MKKRIKINFSDWWPGFDKTSNYFYNLLKDKFDVEISNHPDYLFFSVFGQLHKAYNCKKIFYTGENIAPNLDYANYAFSFDPTNGKNYRLPHYMLYPGYYDLVNKSVDEKLLNRKFCNFVVSNGQCKERNDFFSLLSKYKKIDSGGKHYNNLGYVVTDKKKFQSEYKFSITFENNAYRPEYPYYVTEKPFEAMCVNSIPIYRGGTKIDLDFNTKSFINYHDYSFSGINDVIDKIIELDNDDNKYMEMLKESWLPNNQIPEDNKIENIKRFLYSIFD